MADRRHISSPNPATAPGGAARPASGAIVGFRESSIISLARVGALDARQVAAAFRLARLVRQANAEAGSSFREYVDGGEHCLVAEQATEAMLELRRVRHALGRHGYGLTVSVCAEGHALVDLYASRRQRDTAADILRMHLDELGALWAL